MRASPVIICCWPGLPRLWFAGDWLALGIALAFGAALNLLLVSAVLQPDWLPPSAIPTGWLTLGAIWLTCLVRARRTLTQISQPALVADTRGLFLQAQREYLQGHWFEAESVLHDLLQESVRDGDARLLLATMYRHTKRYGEASMELDRLDQLDSAEKWQWEIAAERKLLRKLNDAASDGNNGD